MAVKNPYDVEHLVAGFPVLNEPKRVVPVYVFGDSHSLAYRNAFVSDQMTGETIATRVRYFTPEGCTAETFFSETRGFHPDLISALEHEWLTRGGRPVHSSFDPYDLFHTYTTGLPQSPPLILISCGDIDLRRDILSFLQSDRDFVLPDDTVYPTSDVPLIPYDLCLRRLEARMSLLVRGLVALRSYGFMRTFLHCIVPPTMDDELFERVNKFRCPVNTRYKAAVLCNRYLAGQCRAKGIPFIDIWPDVTTDGYLRKEFELDGVHLAPASVQFSLRQVLRHGILHGNGTNYRRYELLYQLARGLEPVDNQPVRVLPSAASIGPIPSVPRRIASKCKRVVNRFLPASVRRSLGAFPVVGRLVTSAAAASKVGAAAAAAGDADFAPPPELATAPPWVRDAVSTFHREGICQTPVEPRLFRKWHGMLDYSADAGNRHVTFEWCGNSIPSVNENIRYADPPMELLHDLRAFFDTQAFDTFFQSILGCPAMVLNCRPFMSLPHNEEGAGPQSFHRDGNPVGIIRGLLYLTDVNADSGPFEYQDAAGAVHAATAPAGTLVFFDANRLLHRGSPPRKAPRKVLDLTFSPRVAGQPMLVIGAGMNNWPFDPFQFTLRGMKASPAVEGQCVSLSPYDVSRLLAVRAAAKPEPAAAAA